MTVQTRLPFELDTRAEAGTLTAHGGVPLLIEAFRTSGAAAVLDASVVIKRRKRGLAPAALVGPLSHIGANAMPAESPLVALHRFGQSPWLDFLSRRLLEEGEAPAGLADRRDQRGAGRAARQVGLDVEPLAAVDVAGLVGGELLLVGMVRHAAPPGGAGRGRRGTGTRTPPGRRGRAKRGTRTTATPATPV